jgi:hypothetical protein
MGIGRRKAGTVVRCPSCTTPLVVPRPKPQPIHNPSLKRDPQVFERGDFDEIFQRALRKSQSPSPAKLSPAPYQSPAAAIDSSPAPANADRDVNSIGGAPKLAEAPAGYGHIRLSFRLLALIGAAAVIVLALMFAAGFVVGRFSAAS